LDTNPQPELEPTLHDGDIPGTRISGQHAVASGSGVAATTQKRIHKNVAVTIVVRLVYMVTRVGITSYVFPRIGLTAWGIWSTAFLLVQYLGISNSGLSNVYIKYVAEFDARKEYSKANALLSTGLSFTIPFCAALFAMIVVFWHFIERFVNLPAAYAHDGKEVFLIVFAVFLGSISLQAFIDLMNGMQEIAVVQWFTLVSYIVEIVLIYVFIRMGRGLRGLAEAYLARQAVYLALCIAYDYYKFDWLRISPRLFSRRALNSVLHFGGVVQVQSFFAIVIAAPERILGVRLLGMDAAGLFDLSKKWPSSTSTIPMSFFSAFLPAASNLYEHTAGEERVRTIRDLYLRGARQANIVAAYFCSIMAMLPLPIMVLWLGKKITEAPAAGIETGAMTPTQFHSAVLLFAIFNVAIQIHMLTGPGTSILRGIGRIYEEFWYAIPNVAFIGVIMAVGHIVYHHWTVLNIGMAVSLATLFSAALFLWRAHHVLQIGNAAYIREVLWPGFVPYLVAAIFSIPVAHIVAHHGRIVGVGILLVTGFLYTILFAVVMDRLVLHENERAQWRTLLQRRLTMLRS